MGKPSIKIVASGDFCPSEQVEEKARHTQDPTAFFGEAAALFQSADLAITNLEYPVTFSDQTIQKTGPARKCTPDSLPVLKSSGIDLVVLANNHTLDYKEQGVQDTLNFCAEAGLDTVGAGMSLAAAQQVYYKEIRGITVGVVAFCENEFSVASEDHGGAAPMDIMDNVRQIHEARAHSDIVIVNIHGGNEFSHYPSPRMVKQYRFYADQGASAIVCHHPHYIQGYEIYHGVPILYSLGKLMYTRRTDPKLLEVPIATLTFNPDEHTCSVEFQFFKISPEANLEKLSPPEEAELLDRFQKYCSAIQDPDQIKKEWQNLCNSRRNLYFFMLTLTPEFIFKILRRLKLLNLLGYYARWRASDLRKVKNLVNCEAHREVTLTVLKDM